MIHESKTKEVDEDYLGMPVNNGKIK